MAKQVIFSIAGHPDAEYRPITVLARNQKIRRTAEIIIDQPNLGMKSISLDGTYAWIRNDGCITFTRDDTDLYINPDRDRVNIENSIYRG